MISIDVRHRGDLHKSIMTALRAYIKEARKIQDTRIERWQLNEELMMGYVPEQDHDRLKRRKRELQGEQDYTTIVLPYSYAAAMSAHSYWTTVFLSRAPIFQYEGTHGESQMQVMAVEALMQYQINKAMMAAPFYVWFQDAAKYGEAWVGEYWRKDIVRTAHIVEEPVKYLNLIDTGRTRKRKKITETVGYEGNKIYNISPKKVLTDPRYARSRYQDGEFLAVETTLSRSELAEGAETKQYINVEHLKQLKTPHEAFAGEYVAEKSPHMDEPESTTLSSEDHKLIGNVLNVYEVYVNLIPKQWKLGQGSLPEKWVFTIDTQFTTVLEARPMGFLHNEYPVHYIEVEPEAYSQFSRGIIEIFDPIQRTLDWLINSHFYNVRQTLNNQWLLDPSRVVERDLKQGPGGAIRLKPAAYGTDIRTALMQLPVHDVTQTHLNDMGMMFQMGERLGVNDSVMGLSNPSSRRTAQEIRGSQTFSVSRLKTIAEYMSATGVQRMAGHMLSNSQQYYSEEMKLQIVGDNAQMAGPSFVDVSPEMIAGAYNFVGVDGTLPLDRFAQTNLWREIIMQMSKVPQVIQLYDLGKIFGYVAQLGGIKNLDRFRVEVMPDQQVMAEAQKGNVTPAAGGNILEPGQVSQMGPTA